MMKKMIWILVLAFCFVSRAEANNLRVSNAELKNLDTSAQTLGVEFDISWNNSWRDGLNYDAAWVFMKYSTDNGTTWRQATLSLSGTNPSGFSTGAGTAVELVVPTDLRGCFVQRSASGNGALSTTDVQVLWDYAVDGLNDPDAYSAIILKIVAVEMVYVPQGAFYAGDNAASAASLKSGSSDSDSWAVAGNASIPVTAAASNGFYYVSGGNLNEDATGSVFTVPSAFPEGYDAFYAMKYEVTEGQWVEFFNTLTPAQKTTRDITSASGKNSDGTVNRNTVAWTSGNASTSREDRACSYLSWMDGCAFADWAGLRPLTELEFEKLGRGTAAPVNGEYAWGSASGTAATAISGSEDGTETVSAPANGHFNNVSLNGGDGSSGPLRAGIFATSSSTRATAGAGFYGHMELSGNLSERCVTVGNAAGRSFVGTHGDGSLSLNGAATNSDWPGVSAGEVTGAAGAGYRGGNWFDGSADAWVSDRGTAAQENTGRSNSAGFRAGRSA